jgi:hypothetical protein
VKALLMSDDLRVEPVTTDDAELAARQWPRGEGRSLADRLCLALGERLDAEVLTADTHWGTADRIRHIRWCRPGRGGRRRGLHQPCPPRPPSR